MSEAQVCLNEIERLGLEAAGARRALALQQLRAAEERARGFLAPYRRAAEEAGQAFGELARRIFEGYGVPAPLEATIEAPVDGGHLTGELRWKLAEAAAPAAADGALPPETSSPSAPATGGPA